MKKRNILTLGIAVIISLVVIVGATYAWFTDSIVSAQVDVTTGTIDICVGTLESATNMAPGDKVLVSPNGNGSIQNTGSLPAVVEVSFNDQIKAYLADQPTDEFKSDYAYTLDPTTNASRWFAKPPRVEAIANMTMEPVGSGWNWKQVEDKYYILLEPGDSALLGFIYLNIHGELGGNFKDPATGVYSPDRQFEQATTFQVSYKGTAVQINRQACIDQFGQEVVSKLPNEWFK